MRGGDGIGSGNQMLSKGPIQIGRNGANFFGEKICVILTSRKYIECAGVYFGERAVRFVMMDNVCDEGNTHQGGITFSNATVLRKKRW